MTETLYDHQSPVVDVSCANKNRPVKLHVTELYVCVRSRRTGTLFTDREETLVGLSVSRLCGMAGFATGHNDRRLALWKEEKKRPVGSCYGTWPY
jgi:hypothetical protein